MGKIKIAFIGTGGRSVAYAKYLVEDKDIEIVSLADPNRAHRQAMIKLSNIKDSPEEYDDYKSMLNTNSDLDAVVIASPNFLHAEHAIYAIERGIKNIALEKPIATTQDDCEMIIDAQKANSTKTLVGFVLRSTPFYSKIHELISGGIIGKLISIQADELPEFTVSSIMNRSSWRRFSKMSGGAMLEKACHDLDIMNWMTGSRPLSLNSYGGRNIFNPNPMLPEKCTDCPFEKECTYYRKSIENNNEDNAEKTLFKFVRESDSCIYNIEKDIMDVQSINILYENGAIVNFMLNFNCSGQNAGRNFHAIGQKGRIWGNLREKKIMHFDNLSNELTVHAVDIDGSGHGGGDKVHAMNLKKMILEADYYPEQNVKAGYLSAVMSFASDISCNQGKRINFEYPSDNRIKII